jgi:apolipoprotein N-acyltransferase
MGRRAKLGLVVASVVLLTLSFPPLNMRWLSLVALAPMLWLLSDPGLERPFRWAYLFGFLWQLSVLHWLWVLADRWTGNPFLSLLPWIAASAICALYFAAWGWTVAKLWRRAPWIGGLAWAAFEYLKGNLPVVAFPYGVLPTPLWPFSGLTQMAWVGDVAVLSVWMATLSLLPVLLLRLRGSDARGWWAGAGPAGLIVAVGVGLAVLAPPPQRGEPVRVAAGQPGIDLAFGRPEEEALKVAEAVPYLMRSALVERARLLVLPEGLVQGGATIPPQIPFEVRDDLPVIFGGKRGTGPIYQTAFAYDGAWSYADKTRLVIFGEYVPFRNLPLIGSFNLAPVDIQPGSEVKALQVGTLRVGPLICFEALFPDLARKQKANGAQILAVMSVDDWYFGTGALEVLKAGTLFRAVETGLPVVRAGGLGYSLIADARGSVLHEARLGERQITAAVLQIPPRGMP